MKSTCMTFQVVATCLALLEIPATTGQLFPAEPARVGVKTLQSELGMCPSAADRESALDEFTTNTTTVIRQLLRNETFSCGGTEGWRHVAFINMTDTRYDCPPGFSLTSLSKRTCGQAIASRGGCDSTTFSVGNIQYSKVCGRVIGYTFGSTCAFERLLDARFTIESYYVDGVSLTHGAPGRRQHIWTFASGSSEVDNDHYPDHEYYCPCASIQLLRPDLTFVGNNYFCESGLNNATVPNGIFHPDDKLWDGEDCPSGSTCCELNNPPWFTKTLPNPTTDDIELRMCSQFLYPRCTPVELIDLYVQ